MQSLSVQHEFKCVHCHFKRRCLHESISAAVPQAAAGGCWRLRGASTMLSMQPLTSSSTPTISWSGAALKEKLGTLFFRDGLPAVRHLIFEVMTSTQSAHGIESPSPSYKASAKVGAVLPRSIMTYSPGFIQSSSAGSGEVLSSCGLVRWLVETVLLELAEPFLTKLSQCTHSAPSHLTAAMLPSFLRAARRCSTDEADPELGCCFRAAANRRFARVRSSVSWLFSSCNSLALWVSS